MTTPRIEENLIKHLVDRFLGWKLPADFHPDAGISFKPTFNDTPEVMQALGLTEPMRHEPVGTNLFTAEQAKEMFRFLLENDDGTSILAELFTQALTEAHQAGIDEAVGDKRKLLEDFAEYAHTRYLGTDGKEYAYSQEIIYMAEDYLTIKALQNNK